MDWRNFSGYSPEGVVIAFSLKAMIVLVAGIAVWCIILHTLCDTRCGAAPPPPPPFDQSSPNLEEPRRDYRRVIVAVYHMPGSDPSTPHGLFGRRKPVACPACEVAKADEPRLMEARPDVWWGISGDGKTPKRIVSFNGESNRFRQTNANNVTSWPMFVIYSGTPGSWGDERFRMTGYQPSDYDRLIQMIDWAAEY